MNSESEKNSGNSDSTKSSQSPSVTGFTGGTGGPGSATHPHTISHEAISKGAADEKLDSSALKPEYMAPWETEDDPVKYQYMHFVGTTGAMGGKGDEQTLAKVKAGAPVTTKAMDIAAAQIEEQIKTLNEEDTRSHLLRQSTISKEVISTAQSKMLGVAWIQGKLLVHLKSQVQERKGNWGSEAEKLLIEMKISRRTMDKYINISSTPGILNHPGLGIDAAEMLYQAMSPIRHMLGAEDHVSAFFEVNQATVDYAEINKRDLTRLVKTVIVHEKLRRKGISGNISLIGDFLVLAEKFTSEDLAIMVDRKNNGNDPFDYMREVITNNGKRLNTEDESIPPKQRIKYINAESVKFREYIEALLKDASINKDKIDKSHLEALQSAVSEILDRFFS